MPLAEAAGISGFGDYALVVVALLLGFVALGFAGTLVKSVLATDQGTPRMQDIAKAVQEGAQAYLQRQFRTLGVFAVVVFVLLLLLPVSEGGVGTRIGRALFFLVGATFSALVGYVGMTLATRANVRVASAAREDAGATKAFRIAFQTGGICGMFTVGLGLIGASLVLLIFNSTAPVVLEGFGFGGALLAMFMRVGGGIFTKAADVGADLVGKVEAGIPEDDPRNAATIADNVGDNVGDCAGMAADLFESYAVTLVAALILGQLFLGGTGMLFPLVVAAIGIIASIVGIVATRYSEKDRSGLTAINRGFFISAGASLLLVLVAAVALMPADPTMGVDVSPRWMAFFAVLIGIVLAVLIQLLTGYFTETSRRPVRDIGKASLTGAATVVLGGISLGLESAVYSAVLIGAGVYGAYLIGGAAALYAVALAGCGLLTTAGVIVSMDTFGPVSDNAQGIAEMSGDIDERGARILTDLDAVGNTTKAITKGIAIATAVLAATALFGSYAYSVATAATTAGAGDALANAFVLFNPNNLVGAVLGAAVVFLFSGLAISAVSRAAGRVVYEVREQFRLHPGIMTFEERPDYSRVVDICTKDSLRELATPGLLAIMAPVAVGFGLGVGPLAAYLVGAIACGTLMAVFLANSGGAWDNAKKMVEDGAYGGKGSDAHEATIIGDTVGDPFKDTAGPAINPLIKVMNLVALIIAPAVIGLSFGSDKNTGLRVVIALIAVIVIVGAVVVSKRRSVTMGGEDDVRPSGTDDSRGGPSEALPPTPPHQQLDEQGPHTSPIPTVPAAQAPPQQ